MNSIGRRYFFQGLYGWTNDEVRSVLLLDMEAGQKLTVYNHSAGLESKDFAEIEIKQNFKIKKINSFENSFEDAFVKVTYHYFTGELNGKVSSLRSE